MQLLLQQFEACTCQGCHSSSMVTGTLLRPNFKAMLCSATSATSRPALLTKLLPVRYPHSLGLLLSLREEHQQQQQHHHHHQKLEEEEKEEELLAAASRH